ncbi:MAG: hypothetical protein H6737_02865 [Alphaproteobacteria bacterium]|nr:hypothetical protein [Alphaproteobacteria bacterium]
MGLVLELEGPPGHVFAEIVRLLPDGRNWLISDPEGAVVIAREEGNLVREAIFTALDDGTYDIEVLAGMGVSEIALQGLVGTALFACVLAIVGAWIWGPTGLMGLAVGVCLAGTVPAMVLAVGQRMLDPGRDAGAEKQLERAMRMAIAECKRAKLVSVE